MGRNRTIRDAIEAATAAHTDLNVFYSVVSLLEGGHLYSSKSNATAERIIKVCKSEASRRLDDYDRAVEEIERAALSTPTGDEG